VVVQQDFDREYERAIKLLPEFGEYLEYQLKILLNNDSIRIHRIDSRVKDKKSTQLKLARPSKGPGDTGPRTLDTLTDLLGLRIITYFTQDVDRVADIITPQFTIDNANSVDKRATLDPDRFGYLSLHYVAELNPSLTGFPEYQRYHGIKFEIQIRSILQHAWAEIEHDLGYKTEEAVPHAARRKFAIAAGLLEEADDLFGNLRQALGRHQDETKATIEGGDSAEQILIDQDSLAAFVESSDRVAHIDPQFLGQQAGRLSGLGFRSIEDLSSYIDQNAELLARFIEHWLALAYSTERVGRQGRVAPAVPIGITLYYAGALRYAQDPDDGKVAGHGDWEYSSNLLRRALRAAMSEGNSSAPR
jgi:putative GTP pyrophosphokinase